MTNSLVKTAENNTGDVAVTQPIEVVTRYETLESVLKATGLVVPTRFAVPAHGGVLVELDRSGQTVWTGGDHETFVRITIADSARGLAPLPDGAPYAKWLLPHAALGKLAPALTK